MRLGTSKIDGDEVSDDLEADLDFDMAELAVDSTRGGRSSWTLKFERGAARDVQDLRSLLRNEAGTGQRQRNVTHRRVGGGQ
jgi:hypothetical protein